MHGHYRGFSFMRHIACYACDHQKIPLTIRYRIDYLCDHLSDYLHEPEKPSLIHGDIFLGMCCVIMERWPYGLTQ